MRTNNYVQDEVISISKTIAPWIPYIGLTLAGISVGKYAYDCYLKNKSNNDDKTDNGVVSENRAEGSNRAVPDDN